MYVDTDTYLDGLRVRTPLSPEIVSILIARVLYEDLKLFRHPCGRVVLCSYMNGVYSNLLEFGLAGDQYWASRYFEDRSVKIYDDPPVAFIGKANPNGFGIVPEPGIEDQLLDIGWDRGQMLKVRAYLQARAPVDW